MSFTLLGLATTFAGCTCLYLASPHQRWRARPWPAVPARAAAALLWALSPLLMAQTLQPLAAAFCFATALMLALALLPYSGALLTVLRGAPDGPR
ncbi:hypothetical protein [Rubrivivax gelatinosus]|uniref:Uncharacterized protein n=1 Tax=Rubrivivax gelatinosus (strain NBRC 100245 / IL144) TaxID=983917 RepID=I0HTS1_RUBGI|nr:hypothetical protein [Rubrivivax gelatinosus]BAL96408.1 hypothetical protein RGE_30690 [Rubrivivax gelatinosus IL144]